VLGWKRKRTANLPACAHPFFILLISSIEVEMPFLYRQVWSLAAIGLDDMIT
jgi:hypothetical protein